MLIGYARTSTEEQNITSQLDALKDAGCETIYEDKGITGSARVRAGLDKALEAATEGDVLIVWKT